VRAGKVVGTLSFEVIPLCLSSSDRVLFRNSPSQSACTKLTRRFVAASSLLIMVINASLASLFFGRAFTTMYRLLLSMTTSRYLCCLPGVIGSIGPTRSACILSRTRLARMGSGCLGKTGFVAFPCSQGIWWRS